MTDKRFILLFDGYCGICSATADWVVKNQRNDEIRSEPYQLFDYSSINGLSHGLASNSAVFIEIKSGKFYLRSRAIFETLKRVKGIYGIIGIILSNPVISFISDPIYFLIAKNRARISKILGMNACRLN